MTWSNEQLEQIPEVYKDFMLALKPMIDSRDQALHISGIPVGLVYSALARKYSEYDASQVKELLRNLRHQDFVDQDKFGFIVLRPKGEALIATLTQADQRKAKSVPPLPANV
jgi:hypothetical protein